MRNTTEHYPLLDRIIQFVTLNGNDHEFVIGDIEYRNGAKFVADDPPFQKFTVEVFENDGMTTVILGYPYDEFGMSDDQPTNVTIDIVNGRITDYFFNSHPVSMVPNEEYVANWLQVVWLAHFAHRV